ncbi:MAG: hypothetical protein ACRDRN_04470 [Sciscionella sp.]
MADVFEEPQPEPTMADGGAAEVGKRRKPLLIGSIAAAVVAAVCAAVFGGLWLFATNSSAAEYSQQRDDVLRVAETAAVNFTSIDYQHLDQYKMRADDSTTGALHDSLGKSFQQYSKQLAKNKLKVTSKEQQGVVTALDVHAGTASALVVLNTVTTRDNGKPSSQRMPMTLDLKKVGADWKVSSIGGNASSTVPGH